MAKPSIAAIFEVRRRFGAPTVLVGKSSRDRLSLEIYFDHTATAVEPFCIDHLFLPLGTTM